MLTIREDCGEIFCDEQTPVTGLLVVWVDTRDLDLDYSIES